MDSPSVNGASSLNAIISLIFKHKTKPHYSFLNEKLGFLEKSGIWNGLANDTSSADLYSGFHPFNDSTIAPKAGF